MKRFLSILCALALTLGLCILPAGAYPQPVVHSGRTVDVWDFTGAPMEGAANRITPAAWVESGALVDGTLSVGDTVTFGDLKFVHNANDRIYSAYESPDWAGILGGNAANKYGNTYDDGYDAQGGWYCNGAGGETKRYIELAGVQAGDKIVVYMGSASGDIVLHCDAADATQAETVNAAAKEFGKFTFVARTDGTYKLWTDAAGKAMWHRVVRYPSVTLSGTLALPDGMDGIDYGLKFINQETRQETPASLDDHTTFHVSLAPGYTYNATLTRATGWGFTADSRTIPLTDADAGEELVRTLTVEPKSTYTYSGKIVGLGGIREGFDPVNVRVILVPEEGSGSERVVLTPQGVELAFSAVLDPSVVYTPELYCANDFRLVSPLEVTGEGENLVQDMVVEPKPTYPVSGKFLGADPGDVSLTIVNVDDGFSYDHAKVEKGGYSIDLREGAYYVIASTSDHTTRTHIVVDGKAVKQDLLFVSTAQKPAVDWAGDVYVGYPDKSPNYETVRQAVDAISLMGVDSEEKRVTVHIAPGIYREQVIVNSPYVSFVNDDPARQVLLTWYYGIGYKYYSAGPDGNGYYDPERAFDRFEKHAPDRWGTAVRITPNAVGFRASNITFENSFNRYITDEELEDGVEPEAEKPARNYALDVQSKAATERAAALCVEAGGAEFYHCAFLSSQDTLYTAAGAYFKNCLIEGNTDYIFGSGNVVFDGCELRWKGYSDVEQGGYITAARQEPDQAGYLFRSCAVTANPDLTVAGGYFGRPWGADAAVLFQHTRLETAELIVAEGWTEMSGNKPESARFGELRTVTASGAPVDPAGRVTGARAQSAQPEDYFGTWKPHYYMEDNAVVNFETAPIVTDNGDINLPKPGHTLTVGYSLGAANNSNDVSLIQWYRVKDGVETLVKATAANVSRTYKIGRSDVGSVIKAVVTPATLSGATGEAGSYTLIETVKEGWNDPDSAPGDVELGEGVHIFLAGDSTVKDYGATGMYNAGQNQAEGSWGEWLPCFFDPGQVTVVNYAQGGRSTRNFINEGSLDKIAENIGSGDYLFIQFGHNDASDADQSHLTERHAPLGTPDENGVYPTTPGVKQPTPAGMPASWGEECYTWDCGGTYKWYLKQYIDVARAAGATPVLVTPVARMYYEPDGAIRPHHDPSTAEVKTNAYCAAVKQLAAEENVLCVDAFSLTEQMFVEAYKTCGSDRYGQQTMCVGESTHSNKLGGMLEAALMAHAIQSLNLDVSSAVKAPSKVLGQTPKGETAFLVNAQGRFEAYDMLQDYAQAADYWQGVGQGLFDAIATDRPAGPQVPTKPARPDESPIAAVQRYVVQKGDSLWRIARRLYGDGGKYTAIFDANRDQIKNPNAIYVGQTLTIPAL